MYASKILLLLFVSVSQFNTAGYLNQYFITLLEFFFLTINMITPMIKSATAPPIDPPITAPRFISSLLSGVDDSVLILSRL